MDRAIDQRLAAQFLGEVGHVLADLLQRVGDALRDVVGGIAQIFPHFLRFVPSLGVVDDDAARRRETAEEGAREGNPPRGTAE